MSVTIENDNLMNLADGKTLYDDLADRLHDRASAIYETVTGYAHSRTDSVTFIGNEYAWGNARYANAVNLIPMDTSTTDGTLKNVTYQKRDKFLILNGTASAGDDAGFSGSQEMDIAPGQYVFKIEVYVGEGTELAGTKNMHIDFWYDDNTTSTQSLRGTVSVGTSDVSTTVTLTSHVWRVRVWYGVRSGSVYSDYRIFYSLLPAGTVVTDTEEEISSSGTLTYSIANPVPHMDTLMHKSTATEVADTKTYIDNHTANVRFVYFRPEDYGAVGNGSADDSAALQACIDAAQALDSGAKSVIRGYGTYKISTGIAFNCREMNVYLHRINYTGNSTAVTISASFSTFEFESINAYNGGENAAAIQCYQSSNSGWTNLFYHNIVKCQFIRSNGDCIQLVKNNEVTTNSMMYSKFYIHRAYSVNANVVLIGAATCNENDFYMKLIGAPNGYLIYFTVSPYMGSGDIRVYGACLESELANGTNGNSVHFISCRFTEMQNLQTRNDHTKGFIYKWQRVLPSGCIIDPTDGIDLAALNVSEADSWEDVLEQIKYMLEYGSDGGSAWSRTLGGGVGRGVTIDCVERVANANMLSTNAMRMIPRGKAFVYYNHIAYIPEAEIYHKVSDDMTILLSEENNWDYITPTVFDIDASSVTITLDWSYCCYGINKFDLIQHDGKTAIVIDKLGNTIFDGTNLGPGTYHFKCDFVPYQYHELYVTLTNGTIRYCPAAQCTSVYSGENESWTVTKEPEPSTIADAQAIINSYWGGGS